MINFFRRVFSSKERLLYRIRRGDVFGFTTEELQELANFVKGKRIKDVEWWTMDNNTLAPTFIFTDGSSLELYLFSSKFHEIIRRIKNNPSAGVSWCINDGEEKDNEIKERG